MAATRTVSKMAITIKNEREIGLMREASQAVALVHARIEAAIAPGVTTRDLDDIARDTLQEAGAKSLFLGHLGFKGRICASVNEEIVHGIPGKRVLQDGDIISVDVGARVGGYCGDSAWTYPVGNISDEARHLLEATEKSLYLGIEQAKVGAHLNAIGHAVEQYADQPGTRPRPRVWRSRYRPGNVGGPACPESRITGFRVRGCAQE